MEVEKVVHNDELYSSYGLARGANSNSELKHWKYIKRVKTSKGKWRYYYDKKANTAAKMEDKKKMLYKLSDKFEKYKYRGRYNTETKAYNDIITKTENHLDAMNALKGYNEQKYKAELFIDKHADKVVSALNKASDKMQDMKKKAKRAEWWVSYHLGNPINSVIYGTLGAIEYAYRKNKAHRDALKSAKKRKKHNPLPKK